MSQMKIEKQNQQIKTSQIVIKMKKRKEREEKNSKSNNWKTKYTNSNNEGSFVFIL